MNSPIKVESSRSSAALPGKLFHPRSLSTAVVVVLLAAAVPAWIRWREFRILSRARSAAFCADLESARDQLKLLGGTYPKNAEIAYLSAVVNRRSGALAKADTELQRAEELGWLRKDVLRERWMIDFQSGKLTDAASNLLQLLRQPCSDETATEIYECLVKGYLTDVRLREAEMCLKYWLEWSPNSLPAHQLKADILETAKDVKALSREYEEILRLDPNQHQIRQRLGFLLLENKEVQTASQHFQDCLAHRPNDAAARVGLAACQRQLGDAASAKAALEALLSGDALDEAQRGFVCFELGQIMLAEKQYDRAKECLTEALRLSPSNPQVHYSCGLALARVGDEKAAEDQFRESRELESRLTRLAAATDEAYRAPDDVPLRCEIGQTLLNLGSRKDAFMWLLSALRLDKWHAPTHLALAQYYAEVGDQSMSERHRTWAAQVESAEVGDKPDGPEASR